MKRLLLPVLFFTLVKATSGQVSDGLFSAGGKRYQLYVDVSGQTAVVYNMGSYIDKAGIGSSFRYTDTLVKQTAAGDMLFAGKKASIRQAGNSLYLVAPVYRNDKPKTMMLEVTTDLGVANRHLNNAYWLGDYFRLCDSLSTRFRYYYSFREGFRLWEAFDNKEIHYKDFQAWADRWLHRFQDSIVSIHAPFETLTNAVINNIATIEYEALKDSIYRIPAYNSLYKGYQAAIAVAVANSKPEWFFRLAEDISNRKTQLFDAVIYNKEAIKKLRATDNSSRAKKEFLKQVKRENGFKYKVIGVATAGAVLLGFCIYALAK